MKPNIFLAGPYKQLVDNSGHMDPKSVDQIQTMIEALQQLGFIVNNAHRREGWGQKMMTPDECTKADYLAIKNCDVLIANPGSPASPGTHIELGWAAAMHKPIILLLDQAVDYAYLVRGLHMVTNVTIIRYQSFTDCRDQLLATIRYWQLTGVRA